MVDEKALEAVCTKALADHDGASVSVAVARDGEVVLAQAHGHADVEARRPATPETTYLLASITKPVTAAAVRAADHAGLLDLDAPVERYLGGIRLPRPRPAGEPTVRQVLQHRAGLGTHYDFYYADGARIVPPFAETVAAYGSLYREPGSAFEYSNLGYGLLDVVLREVGADPAALHIGPSPADVSVASARYAADGSRYPFYGTTHPGASLAWSSAPGLAVWGLANASRDDVLPISDHVGYGLGWNATLAGPHDLVWHTGGMGGVSTILVVAPTERLAIAVLTNKTGTGVRDAAADHVLAELLPGVTTDSLTRRAEPGPVTAVAAGTRWSGTARVGGREVPVVLELRDGGKAAVVLDGDVLGEAEAESAGGWDLHVSVLREPELFALVLRAEPGRLTGALRTLGGEDAGRLGDGLSHWCELVAAGSSLDPDR